MGGGKFERSEISAGNEVPLVGISRGAGKGEISRWWGKGGNLLGLHWPGPRKAGTSCLRVVSPGGGGFCLESPSLSFCGRLCCIAAVSGFSLPL